MSAETQKAVVDDAHEAGRAAFAAYEAAVQQEGETPEDFAKRREALWQAVIEADERLKAAQRTLPLEPRPALSRMDRFWEWLKGPTDPEEQLESQIRLNEINERLDWIEDPLDRDN